MQKLGLKFTGIVSLAVLGLAACGQSEAPETPSAADTVDVAEADPMVDEVSESEPQVAEVATTVAETNDDHDHAHAHDDHSHDHDHDDHKHDHDDHDHSDEHMHAHDDHDHDHGGVGEAHVHGEGEMAVTLDGSTLAVSFEGALASFASFEHEPKTDEQRAELEAVRVSFAAAENSLSINTEAGCVLNSTGVQFRHSGNHGSVMADYEYTCASVDEISSISLKIFDNYPALEAVDVVFISDTGQQAKTLIASDNMMTIE
ncbi:MAG: DUF2796 domain-containing protein [Pseudomonadota bacterium]